MGQYTANKKECLRCCFAQWCLNDAWDHLMLRSVDLRQCKKCTRLWWRRNVYERVEREAAFWEGMQGKFDAVFVGRPWAAGCGLMGTIAKITQPRVMAECLCCTVGLPGDEAIFTTYTGLDMTDVSGGITRRELTKQKRLLLVRAKKKERGL